MFFKDQMCILGKYFFKDKTNIYENYSTILVDLWKIFLRTKCGFLKYILSSTIKDQSGCVKKISSRIKRAFCKNIFLRTKREFMKIVLSRKKMVIYWGPNVDFSKIFFQGLSRTKCGCVHFWKIFLRTKQGFMKNVLSRIFKDQT